MHRWVALRCPMPWRPVSGFCYRGSTGCVRKTRLRRPRAFTLIEATISIIIVGVMFVAALNTVGMAARSHVKRSGSDVA